MPATCKEETQIATRVLHEVLSGITSSFGKLIWISSWRVPGSSNYRCPLLESIADAEVVSSLLRDLHNRVFERWLALKLQEQSKDFTEYLEARQLLNENAKSTAALVEKLIPAEAKLAQRYLFETDLAIVFELAEG